MAAIPPSSWEAVRFAFSRPVRIVRATHDVLPAVDAVGRGVSPERPAAGCVAYVVCRSNGGLRTDFRVECPTGSGKLMTLADVARELSRRLATLFVPDADGRRPCHGNDPRYQKDPHWRDLVTFAEYFCGDTGRGVGARYQGWTTLAIRCFEDLAA